MKQILILKRINSDLLIKELEIRGYKIMKKEKKKVYKNQNQISYEHICYREDLAG